MALDRLEINGTDLRRDSWEERRKILVRLVQGTHGGIQLSEHVDIVDGPTLFHHACAMGLEGIVAKRRDRHGKLAATLWRAAQDAKLHQGIQMSEHLDGADGDIVFQLACKLGLEGIVARRRDRPYKSGRSSNWVKLKNPDAPAATRIIE